MYQPPQTSPIFQKKYFWFEDIESMKILASKYRPKLKKVKGRQKYIGVSQVTEARNFFTPEIKIFQAQRTIHVAIITVMYTKN